MAVDNDRVMKSTERDLVITHVIAAPRELVFRAWTEPEHVKHWWGPRGFTTPVCQIDLCPGGKYLSCMRSPEGKDYWSTGVYREIVVPEKIVVTDSFADEHGNVVPASYYGMSGDVPLEMLITVTFEERDGKTTLTLRHSGLPEAEGWSGAETGWNESFDKLVDYAASLQQRAQAR